MVWIGLVFSEKESLSQGNGVQVRGRKSPFVLHKPWVKSAPTDIAGGLQLRGVAELPCSLNNLQPILFRRRSHLSAKSITGGSPIQPKPHIPRVGIAKQVNGGGKRRSSWPGSGVASDAERRASDFAEINSD